MNEKDLLKVLEKSWCKETAFGDWKPEVPSMNQCAITALVVQDLLGGEILRCEMTNGDSHYWNLVNYKEVDLTQEQFNHIVPKPIRDTKEIRTRQYILSYPNTMYRYGLLLQKVAENLKK